MRVAGTHGREEQSPVRLRKHLFVKIEVGNSGQALTSVQISEVAGDCLGRATVIEAQHRDSRVLPPTAVAFLQHPQITANYYHFLSHAQEMLFRSVQKLQDCRVCCADPVVLRGRDGGLASSQVEAP
jgi:hypothetical protein